MPTGSWRSPSTSCSDDDDDSFARCSPPFRSCCCWQGPAGAQSAAEVIHDYRVEIQILDDGDLEDHGDDRLRLRLPSSVTAIFRTIPTRFPYDDVNDRVFPIEDVTVESPTARADIEISEEGRHHDDPDRRPGRGDLRAAHVHADLPGRGSAERVPGSRRAVLERDRGRVAGADRRGRRSPFGARARSSASTCFQGYEGSTEPCAGRRVRWAEGPLLARPRAWSAFEGMTVVVAIPKGTVPEPGPILEERWSAARAFS